MKVILTAGCKRPGQEGPDDRGSRGLRPELSAAPEAWPSLATADAINTMRLQEKARKAEEADAKAKAAATEIAEKLKGLQVKVASKGGEGGKLFGAVTGQGDRRRSEGAARRGHRQQEAGAG